MTNFNELSNAELRLELAEAEQLKPTTHRATWHKRDRIDAVTNELLRRGAF